MPATELTPPPASPDGRGQLPSDPEVMSDTEAEDKLAALMDGSAPTPAPAPADDRGFDEDDYPDDEPESSVLDADDADDAADADADGLPDDPLALDSEAEFEWEGKKYVVPKPLVENAMRAKQYTEQVQQVAAQRAYLQEQANALQESVKFQSEVAPLEFQAQNMASQIEQLTNLLPEYAGDVDEYRRVHGIITDLKQQHHALSEQVAQRKQALGDTQKATRQRLVQASDAILARDIPNWGRETYKAIGEHAQAMGFTPVELQQIIDPRFIKLAHDSLELKRLKDRRSAARDRAANPSANGQRAPAPVIRPGAANPNTTGQRANAQQTQTETLVKRARKSGNASDAEAALTALLRGSARR